MKIKFWGTRGSIASPGPATVKYGGNTTCLEIIPSKDILLVVDAGTGIRKLGQWLMREKKFREINLFLTHAHWDHIQGFPFFAPAYHSEMKINIFGCFDAAHKIRQTLSNQMESVYFPVDFEHLKAEIEFEEHYREIYIIGEAELQLIQTNHPGDCYGLKVDDGNSRLVFLTDNELDFPEPVKTHWTEFVEFCKGVDLLIHDAQYTEEEIKNKRGWGHSTSDQALKLALEAQVKSLALFHHDPDRSDEEVEVIIRECQRKIKKEKADLHCFAAGEEQEILL